MAGVELATAYINLAPSARGIVNAVKRDIAGSVTDAAAGEGERAGVAMGDRLHRGLAGKIAGIGTLLAGIGGIAIGVGLFKGAISEATEAQKVMGQTGAVIKSTGDASGLSANQFGDLATRLSEVAGVDDEVIQQGENVLATFTNVKNGVGAGNDIFTQATGAALDMSKAMGTDLQSSIVQVGKALQDPVAGVGALQRVGVRLTDQQKDQVKAFVASGDVMSAQKLILKELATEFGGTAAAVATPMEKLQVTFKNVLEAVGTAIAPALAPLGAALSTVLVALQPVLTTLGVGLANVLLALSPVITALAPPLGQIIGLLAQLLVPVASLLVAFAPIAALVLQLAGAFLQALLPAITPLIGVLTQVVSQIAVALQPVIAQIIPIIQQNAAVFAQFIQALLPLIPALGQIIIALLPILPPLLDLATLWIRVYGAIIPVIAVVVQLAAILIGGLAQGIAAVVGWLKTGLVPFFEAVPGAVLGALEAVGRFISEGIQKFLDFGGRALAALTDLPDKMFHIGVDAAESIGRGLFSLIGKLGDIANSIKKKLVDTLNPANWFSTPEEHYRMLWGAAFASIADEGERNLGRIGRTVDAITAAGTPTLALPDTRALGAFTVATAALPQSAQQGANAGATGTDAGHGHDIILNGEKVGEAVTPGVSRRFHGRWMTFAGSS
jgi:phage-related protein